jgi:hypothetical protein
MSHEFVEQTSTILHLASSLDGKIACETMMILIVLCESYEEASPVLCRAWYDPQRFERCQLWSAFAQLMTNNVPSTSNTRHTPTNVAVRNLPSNVSDSSTDMNNETMMYVVAVIAALTYPSQCLPGELLQAKLNVSIRRRSSCTRIDHRSTFDVSLVLFKVANALALKLLEPVYASFRDVWLGQFRTLKCTSNVLKVNSNGCMSTDTAHSSVVFQAVYGFCLSTIRFSQFLFNGTFVSDELTSLLRGQVRETRRRRCRRRSTCAHRRVLDRCRSMRTRRSH